MKTDMWYNKSLFVERKNTNEINNRTTWRSRLFNWFTYWERMERGRISLRKIVKAWCKRVLYFSTWKSKRHRFSDLEKDESHCCRMWLAERVWCSDRPSWCYRPKDYLMGLASAGLDEGRAILSVWPLVWKRKITESGCKRLLWLCNGKVWWTSVVSWICAGGTLL